MVKQVILIRKDLKMRRGKECAQASHSSLSFLSRRIRVALGMENGIGIETTSKTISASANGNKITMELTLAELEWIQGPFKKVVLQVNSEDELRAYHQKALDAGLESSLIIDSGATEFHNIPTPTCCCIGPDYDRLIDLITGNLKLY